MYCKCNPELKILMTKLAKDNFIIIDNGQTSWASINSVKQLFYWNGEPTGSSPLVSLDIFIKVLSYNIIPILSMEPGQIGRVVNSEDGYNGSIVMCFHNNSTGKNEVFTIKPKPHNEPGDFTGPWIGGHVTLIDIKDI